MTICPVIADIEDGMWKEKCLRLSGGAVTREVGLGSWRFVVEVARWMLDQRIDSYE
jgi:hypothetical protein